MTQDEIIDMAVKAGLLDMNFEPSKWEIHEFTTFAKLVADVATAKEREACAQICENYADYDKEIRNDYHAHLIRARGEA